MRFRAAVKDSQTPSTWTRFSFMAGYRAQYSDGLTASSTAVLATTGGSGIAIVGDNGTAIDHWDWSDIRLSEPTYANRPIRLANRSKQGARLTIDDPGALSVLRTHAPYLSREPLDRTLVTKISCIVGACAAVALFFIYGLPWVAKPLASLMPVSWEERTGESTVVLINKLFANDRPLCSNTAGVAALKKLSGKLQATYETPYAIRVDVADSPIVNALAAPGGRIVLFRGLIEKAKAPDEVAGVLAHEMAHVINRHPTQGMINAVGWSSLMSVFTGGASLSNEAVARLAAHLATSAQTRDLEAEADDRAVVMLKGSGIGTDGMASFFKTLQKQEAKGLALPSYLSSHPETKDRIGSIVAKRSAAKGPALSQADWKALRTICK